MEDLVERSEVKPGLDGNKTSFDEEEEKMEKFYIVETMNELTVTREHYHTEALTAQEAVDYVKDKIGDMRNYSILNVFVETEEEWQ